MSPILVRPVREQLEHDRLIRFLVAKYQKQFEVIANVGESQPGPVKLRGPSPLYPDLVLLSEAKIAGLVEIETAESTNNLEALAQWQHFGRARVPFHLYVPLVGLDAALRFCEAYKINVTEIWTYRALFDGFDLVRAFDDPAAVSKTPKSTSAMAKLLPPVTETKVEPEGDAKLAELTSLVELANRTFKVAAGKSAAANAAAKAAAASARAAARAAKAAAKAAGAKPPAPPAEMAQAAAAAEPAGGKAASPAKSRPASKKEKPAKAKPAKPKKAAKSVKAPAKRTKPAKKAASKASKRAKTPRVSAPKSKSKPKPKSAAGSKAKKVAVSKPRKAVASKARKVPASKASKAAASKAKKAIGRKKR